MSNFFILETESGLTIAEALNHETLEEAALRHGGVVEPDAHFYRSFEDAMDVLAAIPSEQLVPEK